MALTTYIDAITQALREEMQRDPNVFILGEDVGVMGGVFKATKGLFEEFGADRVIDSPLAEGVIVSASIGAALAGMRPCPEIQFSDFITPAMDAIVEQAAKLRYRSAGTQTCPLTLRVCYGGGVGGGLYHSQTNTTWFAHEPGLVVLAPGTVYDAKGMLKAAIRDDNPVIFFEHKKLYRSIKEDIPEDDYVTDIYKAAVRREGKDITAVSYGYTLQLTLQAAEKMKEEHDVDVEVVDLRVLNPLDKDTVLESVAKTSRVVIVHEDHRTLGIGAEISATLAEEAFDCLDAPIVRVTAPDVPAIPFSAPLEKFYMPSVEKIVTALERTIEY
ncbi:MAG: alpha-ketoacid dehydrogenase subunit beta [Candidatus Koribacter versatilis]|uniref:Alpha-ketoacid dehydrogenase subunit beta n=1 Tax=Candidatus Korobacter versatilis TaxID=658062 RepID=A0A932ENL1_9BACT|nr:alpha-ketoacid dehydrogenase subunit beta [Candidatus Koribacter versatilis]